MAIARLIVPLMFALLLAGGTARGADRPSDDLYEPSLKVVRQQLGEEKAVLVDVRSQKEWDRGHVEGALFVPIDSLREDIKPEELAKQLPEKKLLFTYCMVGVRARIAAEILAEHGYQVRFLEHGYPELIEAGFEKAVPEKKVTAD